MQTLCQLSRGLFKVFWGRVLSYAKLGVEFSAGWMLKIQLLPKSACWKGEMRKSHVLMMWVNLLMNQWLAFFDGKSEADV